MELIASIFFPEDVVQLVQSHPALVSFEAIVDQKVDKDDLLLCPDSVGFSTDVLSRGRSDEFSRCVGDDFLVSCIGVHMLISVFIAAKGSMDSQLVMVALRIELEMPYQSSNLVVMLLKLKPMIDVAQVGVEIIASTGDDEV